MWRDIRPSMTHTRNLCSAFNPSKVHTHSSEHTHTHREHTPGAVGSHLCCGTRGAVGGSVPCSRAPQSWYWGWRECWTFTPPTIPAEPFNYKSNSLTIRPWLPPKLISHPRPTRCTIGLGCPQNVSVTFQAKIPHRSFIITAGKCHFWGVSKMSWFGVYAN